MKPATKQNSENAGSLLPILKTWIIPAAIPLLLTIIAFSGTLHDSFTNWDDDVYVTQNNLVRSLSLENILRIFSPHSLVCGNYQPVTILSLAANFAFGKLDPQAYILTNIILHLANVLLVFLLVMMLSRSSLVALWTAALFGLHPMHVESVAWVAGRKDMLFVLFYLAAMICYLSYLKPGEKRRRYWYAAAASISVLSILSKSSAVTLPVAFLLLDYLKGRKFSSRVIVDKLVFLAICIPPGIYSIIAQQNGNLLDPGFSIPGANRFWIGIESYSFYVIKFFLPVHLSAYYPYPVSHIPWHDYILPLAALVATAVSMCVFRRQKPFMFGLSFFILNVIFILHFVPVGRTMVADRFSYIAYIGPAYAAGFYILRMIESRAGARTGRLTFAAGAIALAAILCFGSHSRSVVWKNSLLLWNDVAGRYPDPVSLTNRGNALLDAGKPSQSIPDYARALEMDPRFVRAYYNRALAFSKTGAGDKALEDLSAAIRICPTYVDALLARGNEYASLGEFALALEDFNRTIELNKSFGPAYAGRGVVFQKSGNADSALADLTKAIALSPDQSDAYVARGDIFGSRGEIDRAIRDYAVAIALDSLNETAYSNCGLLYNSRGVTDSAIAFLTRAISLNPHSATAYTGRAVAFGMKGLLDRAKADLDSSIRIDPADPKAWFNRGLVFMSARQQDSAIANMTKALALDPRFAQAYNNRGALYAMQKRWALSLADFNTAVKLSPGDASLAANRDYVEKMMGK